MGEVKFRVNAGFRVVGPLSCTGQQLLDRSCRLLVESLEWDIRSVTGQDRADNSIGAPNEPKPRATNVGEDQLGTEEPPVRCGEDLCHPIRWPIQKEVALVVMQRDLDISQRISAGTCFEQVAVHWNHGLLLDVGGRRLLARRPVIRPAIDPADAAQDFLDQHKRES